MREQQVASRLADFNVPDQTIEALTEQGLISSAVGLVLYGSYARGDHTPDSDVDVLVVAPRPSGSRTLGIANVSTYTPAQLASARGSLFGMHLRRDGEVLADSDGTVANLLENMGDLDPRAVFERIRHLGAVLGDGAADLSGRVRVARYLLRTAIYVEAIDAGEPCFSVRELGERLDEPSLVAILSADPAVAPPSSEEVYADLTVRLRYVVGEVEANPHGTVRNLIVAEWESDPGRATLGVLVVAGDRDDVDYSALAKIVL